MICRPFALSPLPVGVPGELFISGPGLARGYIGRPDLTEAAFLANPFRLADDNDAYARMYRTGDNVMWLPSGINKCCSALGLSDFLPCQDS